MDTEVGRKRSNVMSYKRNIIKKAIRAGDEYINHKGKNVEKKTTGPPCRCRKKCFDSISPENREEILTRLYSMTSKNQQDSFLQSLIEVLKVQRHRPRKIENPRVNSFSFQYFVYVGEFKKLVCLKAFLSLHSVSMKRIKRLRDLTILGKSPKDQRGLHSASNALSGEIKVGMLNHIESFPTKLSHYSGKEVKYLNEQLSVKTMYNLFKAKYPNVKVGYVSYYKFFKDNFDLKFGRPQVDVCCTCENLNLKIKNPCLNDAAKKVAVAELMVHKRRSKKFYNELKVEVEEKNKKTTNIVALCFDYMQNLCLPKIPVQEMFYWRQLSVSVFCIHDIKTGKSTIFLYHEGQAKKGPDEVCSFLDYYIKNNISSSVDELHLYSDNCGGQNKNHTLSRMLLALTDTGRFKKIIQNFPVRGHSFLPCDRDFALIKRYLKNKDRIYTPHQFTEYICQTKSDKFQVVEINSSDIKNFKSWWPKYYKKDTTSIESRSLPRNQKTHFGISSFAQFIYMSEYPGTIFGYPLINGLLKSTFPLMQPGKRRTDIKFPETCAYENNKLPIKNTKMNDIKKTYPYIDHPYKEFYDDIFTWPTDNQ